MEAAGAERRLEVLGRDECWRLLPTRSVGRLAVNRRGTGPLVVPVVYAVGERRRLVFRTGIGTKLARIARGAVSLQVDDVDEERRTGWSVLVEGLAHEVDVAGPDAAGVEPWLPTGLDHAVVLVPNTVSGRRLA